MKFLSSKSTHLLMDMLPEIGSIVSNRITNYLSFYLSSSGNHLYYAPHLMSSGQLKGLFGGIKPSNKDTGVNYEHLFARNLLTSHFQEHVVDEQGSYRLLADLRQLHLCSKKDIAEEILRIRCKMDSRDRIIPLQRELPAVRRRNMFVSYRRPLPGVDELERLITLNPFFQLPNLNKILVFTRTQSNLHLPAELQDFCSKHSVKIKLFDDANMESIIQFLYHRSKSNILIHELVNSQKEHFSLLPPPARQTPPNDKANKKGKAKLQSKYKPQDVVLFLQRLPKESVRSKDSQNQILAKMRQALGLEDGQNLIDPVKRIDFATIQKNYRFEESDVQMPESKLGFSMRRYVTESVYEFTRMEEIQPEIQSMLNK